MNMLEAMRDTIALMEIRLTELAEEGDQGGAERMHIEALSPDLRPGHLRDMLRMMVSDINPQNPAIGFSDGKMGRWLGWAQAAVVAMGLANLDEMKAINMKWATP